MRGHLYLKLLITVSFSLLCASNGTAIRCQSPEKSTPDPPPSIASTWEGEILDAKRPIVTQVDYVQRIVRFDTSGNTAWPLTSLFAARGEIDFASQAGNFRFEFRGKKTLDQIDGTVDFADRHLPFTIRRLPSLPKPQNRVEAWQQDIAALSSRFIHYDRSFSPKERDAFLKSLQTLNASLPNLPDQAVMVRLANTLAISSQWPYTALSHAQPHTGAPTSDSSLVFRDGLYIIRADRQNASLLGCQIRKIGPATTPKLSQRLRALMLQRYMEAVHEQLFLTSPDILLALG